MTRGGARTGWGRGGAAAVMAAALAAWPAAPAHGAAPDGGSPAEPAVPEGDTGATPAWMETTVTGYLDNRLTAQRVRTDRLVPANDVPILADLTEWSFQLKLRFGEKGMVLADASFFHQLAGGFPGGAHDVPGYRPLAVISEAYGSLDPSTHVNVTAGKKRIVWGPGMAFNPTDLLNPRKDPSDPTHQRAGAWLARIELTLSKATLSLVAAAQALREHAGVPSALVYYPSYDAEDDGRAHFAAAARLYLLVADTDLNAELFFTNLYLDEFERKTRLGLSASRLIGKALEVHVEALAQRGSARLYVDPACVADLAAAAECTAAGRPVAGRSRIDDSGLVVRALVGARYTFADDSMLSAEALNLGDGYDAGEWEAFLRGLVLAGLARDAGVPLPGPLGLPGAGPPGGTPHKVRFEPLRRHYLFLGYSKPRIRDDFTASVLVLGGLADLSGQIVPQVSWSVREWLTVSAAAYLPVPGVPALATDVDGTTQAEFGLPPADLRGVLAARLHY